MTIRIGSNIASLKAQGALSRASDKLSSSFERLSSGLRINHASDDAAGPSVSSSLSSDVRIYTQGIRNLNDGLSFLSIADGTLSQLNEITTRQKELAEQAANGTYSYSQRKALDTEAQALRKEYNRIISVSKFNGVSVFNETSSGISLQAGRGTDATLSLTIGQTLARDAGDGIFQAPVQTTFGGLENSGMDIGDINGDGFIDAVRVSRTNQIGIRLGNGNGTFQPDSAIQYAGAGAASNIRLGDFNGDSRLDYAVGNEGGILYLGLGNGNGTFSAPQSSTFSSGIFEFEFEDINDDGTADIVGNGSQSGTVGIWAGNTIGILSGSIKTVNSAYVNGFVSSINLSDLNNDGTKDIIFASPDSAGSQSIKMLLSNSDGSFQLKNASTSGYFGFTIDGIQIGDLNQDGVSDLATFTRGTYFIALGNSDGTFKAHRSYVIDSAVGGGGVTTPSTIGDVNQDGNLDLISGDWREFSSPRYNYVLLGNGDGTFSRGVSLDVGAAQPIDVQLVDINRDGVDDIIELGRGSGTLITSLGNTRKEHDEETFSLLTKSEARSALTSFDTIQRRVTLERSNVGAAQSRIQVAINTLAISKENYQSAYSRIMDVDVAQEAADLTRQTILQQTASSVLQKSNLEPQIVLKLLQSS